MFKLASIVGLLLLAGISASAQSLDTLEVRKNHRPWVAFTSARIEKLFDKGSSLFVEYSTLLDFQKKSDVITQYNSLNENYSSFLWAGYEHAFTEHWYGGISGRANFVQEGYGSFFTRMNVAHRGHISKLFFYKEFAFEYLSYSKDNAGVKRLDEGRISPGGGLGYRWKFGKQSLYVGVDYRLFVNFDFKQDKSSNYDKRKIDRTKFKAEISYHFLPHWNISVYYLRDTQYYCVCGNDPAYKANDITDGVGITVTHLLFKDNSDKYVTELPIR